MPHFLPDRPDPAQLRRQAKELHRAAAAGDAAALRRVRAVSADTTLAAAQLAIAREHGFGSWPRLAAEVTRKAMIATGDLDGLAALLATHPALARDQLSSRYQATRDGSGSALEYLAVARFHGATDHDAAGRIAEVLLAAGAPVDGPGGGDPPLIGAASYDETDLVRVLVEAGADLEAVGHGMPGAAAGTALAHAVEYGCASAADILVAAGARIPDVVMAAGAGDLTGFLDPRPSAVDLARALRAAAVNERCAVVDQLLSLGVPVDAELPDGATALHHAAYHGKPDAVRQLLARGADPGIREGTHGGTPLDWCRHRWHELTRLAPTHGRGHAAVNAVLAPVTTAD